MTQLILGHRARRCALERSLGNAGDILRRPIGQSNQQSKQTYTHSHQNVLREKRGEAFSTSSEPVSGLSKEYQVKCLYMQS